MTKFPLLEQMRSERDRHETEIRAPVVDALSQCQRHAEGLLQSLRAIEEMVGRDIAKHIVAEVGAQLSAELRKQIFDALIAAGQPKAKPVVMTLSPDTLRFMDPRSLEREVLDRYVSEAMPRVRLRMDTKPHDRVTIMDIRIPELGFRRAVAELIERAPAGQVIASGRRS